MTRQVALVTGASRGLGAAIARRLAEDGWDLVVNYHRTPGGAEAVAANARAAGARVLVAKADVSDPEACAGLVARAVEAFGRLDAVVNNAGVYHRSAMDDIGVAEWRETMDTNLSSAFFLSKAAAAHLPRGGRVVNVSSILGATGSHHGAHYTASKGGVIALTKSLAQELAPGGVLVNAVAPGAIDTDMIGEDTATEREARNRKIPLGRVGRPEEIAGVVAFLLGPDSTYVTGQVLHANGGLYM